MNTRTLWPPALLSMSLVVALEVANAQSIEAAPESWKVANPQLTKDAKNAYKDSRLALINMDYRAMVRMLADNALPLVPKDRQTEETIASTATQLQKSSNAALKLTRQIQIDVDALGPSMGPAMMLEIDNRNERVVLVRMPLRGTREVAARYRIHSSNWTIDETGDLCVLMVKHAGIWFWNPFGW